MKNPPFTIKSRWSKSFSSIGRFTAATLVAASLTLGLTGCAAGTSSESDEGNLSVSLTDAPGDFSIYAVDVSAISLTKANGVTIETLPLTTTVDFAQYIDMTEFLTAGTVPSGRYTSGSITIDFSGATIQVEDDDGETVAVTLFVDTNGNPISSLEVAINLDDQGALTIAPGIPSHLSLDFDLKTSNSVDFSDPDNPVLTIDPVLIAEVNIERDKPHRIRGPLKSVDLEESSYTVILRPFFHKQSNDTRFGQLDVITDADTVFDIDGSSFVGADGIEQMATLNELTATRAIGNFKLNPRRFIATQVLAGSSVEGGNDDVVRGTVTARENNTLTIQGATLIRTDGSFSFNKSIAVLLADSTEVKKQRSTEQHQISEISVGQRIAVFGVMTDLSEDNMVLDASNGTARLMLTSIRGQVLDSLNPAEPELAINLNSINHRRVSLFDFTGTGTESSDDANPEYYQLETGSMDINSFSSGTATLARGFIAPFGSAPKDFEVRTLVNFQALPANLIVMWRPPVEGAFATLDSTGFTLNLSESEKFHHLSQGGVRTDLTTLAEPVTIQPGSETTGVYAITEPGKPRTVHTDFEAFVTDLMSRLENGATTRKVHVHGNYDEENNQLVSGRIWVDLR